MIPQYEQQRSSVAEFEENGDCRPKGTLRPVSNMPRNMLMVPQHFINTFCGMTGQKREVVHPITSHLKLTQQLRGKKSYKQFKNGSSRMTVWVCFAASGRRQHAGMDGTIDQIYFCPK